ncbi:MAG: response regulator [Gemmatimonadota bacterium]
MDAPLRPLHVLLADDEAMLRLAIRLTLEDRGHRVTEAPDADRALVLARAGGFDLAILDVNMPGDGLRLLARLLDEAILPGRILMLTADVARWATREELERRGIPWLAKPFDFGELTRTLERMADEGSAPAG